MEISSAARKSLVVHNLRLVISIAYQYRQAWTNVLDLFQEGSVGLLEAVKHWDPTWAPGSDRTPPTGSGRTSCVS